MNIHLDNQIDLTEFMELFSSASQHKGIPWSSFPGFGIFSKIKTFHISSNSILHKVRAPSLCLCTGNKTSCRVMLMSLTLQDLCLEK